MDFSRLKKYHDMLPELYGFPFCELSVSCGHERVFRHSVGNLPFGEKTIYRMYSMSKLLTVSAIFQLWEKGILDIDDPVYKFLPAYKSLRVEKNGDVFPAKNIMTIRHLLSMRSGLTYEKDKPNIAEKLQNRFSTTREIADALAYDTLAFEPGENWCYGWSHDVLGAVVEHISDMSFGEYLRKSIFEPLEIEDMTFFPTEEQKKRIAPLYEFENASYSVKPCDISYPPRTERFESGGGGLFGTNDGYMKFAVALANSGVASNGYRVLMPESINQMKVNHQAPQEQREFSRGKPGYGYGLGVRTLIDREDALTQAPFGEFGWDGMAASYSMLDTENKISVVWTTHVVNCRPAYREIHPHIRNLTYAALGIE